jgi:hypothetical protein
MTQNMRDALKGQGGPSSIPLRLLSTLSPPTSHPVFTHNLLTFLVP